MIDIVVFDIDGTLTDRNGAIPSSVDDAVKQLKSHKTTVLIATGRPPFEVSPDIKKRLNPDAIVYYNGSLVMDGQGNVLHEKPLDEPLLSAALDRIHELGWDCALHLRENTLVIKGTSIQQKIVDITGKRPKPIIAKNRMVTEPVFNIMVHVNDPIELEPFLKDFPQLKAEAFAPEFYDLYLADVNKATGIEHILKRKNASWNRVMAFGDNINDIGMLKKAYYGIIMENGHPDLHQVKGLHMTQSSDNDGIANALMKFGLIEHSDNRMDWIRFKHRFQTTMVRYTLPISFFLLISVIYDQMREKFTATTWTNLILGVILFSSALYEVLHAEKR